MAEPRPKTNLVHFCGRWTLIAIITIIFFSAVMDVETHTAKQQKCDHVYIQTPYKGILSNDKPAICRMWSSAQCQAQGGTPRRNASLAFRLERLQKFRYGVPPFQKVPVQFKHCSLPDFLRDPTLSINSFRSAFKTCLLAAQWDT